MKEKILPQPPWKTILFTHKFSSTKTQKSAALPPLFHSFHTPYYYC